MKRALLFLLVALVLPAFGQRGWIQKNPPPFSGRYALVSFVIGNYAYAGLGSIDAEQRIYSAEFYRYDPVADSWTRMPDFPGGRRYSATAFALNGKGYICNGVDSTHMWRSDVWEFDPGSETWAQKNPFPGGDRYGSGSFVIGDHAYLVAGSYNAGFDYLKDLWCYTPL
ncbi:MAG TPA: kelch repeat-containing protein, partial [Bacteroidales bacterium]|nr:kelch repeat-containing protein [Bacteroidales bacterium]